MWRGGPGGGWSAGTRAVAEEVPVAFSYNGSAHAVMMASPLDLEDFALGFSLTEGFVEGSEDVEEFEVAPQAEGVVLRIWLAERCRERLEARRRRMAGPAGCGLCGIESLEEAARAPGAVGTRLRFAPEQVMAAMASLEPAQRLGAETRAVHAAGLWTPGEGLVAAREDVGRHNALDKLAGALARAGRGAADAVVVLTSRVSVELVQKAARMGAGTLVAISAPTTLAVRMAEAAGMTLVGVARGDGFEVFCGEVRP